MGDVNISELLGDQPLIENDGDGSEELLEGGQDDLQPTSGDDSAPTSDEPPATGKRQSKVPLAALQEERTRRQELQDQLKARDTQQQAMEQRFTQLMQLVQSQQQPQIQQQPPEVPSFVDDPEGHVNALRAQFEQELAQLRGYQQQNLQQQQAAQQGQELARHVAQAEAEFSKATPDYNDAAAYFVQRKQLEYAALGADPMTIQQAIRNDYQGIAIAAQQTGKNAAQLLYNLSKAMGFTGRQTQPASKQQKPAPTSLSNVNGAPRAPDEQGGVTLESVSNMTDAEFDKFFADMARKSRQRPTF